MTEKKTTFDSLPDLVDRMSIKLDEIRSILIKQEPTAQQPIQNELLTIDEVAELLHLSKPTVYSKHSKGELPGVCKRSKRLYFDRQIIIDWIKSARMQSNAEIQAEAKTHVKMRRGEHGNK